MTEGTHGITITATDAAGNESVASDALSVLIDTTPPTVPTGLNPASGSYTSETSPVLSWNASSDPGGSGLRSSDGYRYVVDGGSSGYTTAATYQPGLAEGEFSWKIRARDVAGNNSDYTSDTALYIDTTDPTDPSPASTSHTVGEASTDDTVDITIGGAGDPLSNGVSSGVDGFDYEWDKNPTWAATEVKDQEETWIGGTFTATSDGDWYFHIATCDNVGHWTATEHLGPFTIDTLQPTTSSLTENLSMIAEANVGDKTFTLTIGYSEPMDTDVAPTVSFPVEDPTGTITLDTGTGGSGWSDSDTYVARYDVADANAEIDLIDVRVTGAKDLAGNMQVQYDEADVFGIDTVKPSVTNVAIDTNPVYQHDLSQQVTVTFDGAMATGTIPAIIFSHGTWAEEVLSRAWSALDTVFTVTYTLTDNDEEFYDPAVGIDVVTIDVTGAKDAAGNDQGDYAPQTEFDIDTLQPTLVDATALSLDGCYKTAANIILTLTFSEDVRCVIPIGGLRLVLDVGGARAATYHVMMDTSVVLIPTDSVTWAYVVASDENSCDLTLLSYSTGFPDNLVDWASNVIDYGLPAPGANIADHKDIAIDTTIPVIDPIASDKTAECDGAGNVADLNTWLSNHGGASATDNCSGGTWSHDFTTLSDDCGETGSALVTFTATDACDNFSTTQATFTIEDTTPPSITTPASDETVECDGAGNVTDLNTWLNNHGGASATDDCSGVTWSNDFTTLSDDCGETGSALVTFTATDACGNFSTTQATFTMEDTTPPSITTPANDETVECTGAGNTAELNAWLASHGGAAASDACCGTDVTWSNDFTTLSDDCGETGSALVTFTATDCCGLSSTTQATFTIEDTTIPVINDLMFTDATWTVPQADYYVDDCCEATLYFSANVTDNCCMQPDRVSIGFDFPAGDAEIANLGADVVQNGPNRLDVYGFVTACCLTSCPARAEILIRAGDCCDNRAVSVTTGPTEGLVWDEVAPIPRDDPRQDVVMDESAIIDPNDPTIEVRLDEFGVYRLILREDTPVRIDVVTNDGDNCSCEDCAHPFDPCGGCGPCTGCCATMTVHEIVTPPMYGTATIEDATGDCTGGSVIRFAPDQGYIGPDEFTYRTRDACGNVSSEIATVYVQTVAKVAMEDVYVTACSGEPEAFTVSASDLWVDYDPTVIPFLFEILGGPEHGIVTGDPTQVTLTPPSTVDVGGEPVPTLDFTETANITLTYTSAVGYTGPDVIAIRFADPFGDHTTGRVDVSVTECTGEVVGVADIVVKQGEILPLIVPESFEAVVETAWGSVLLMSLDDGTDHSAVALRVAFNDAVHRYVIYIDTGPLPVGEHLLSLPLGNGETVELTIEVCAPDP